MGHSYQATCNECGRKSRIDVGGGFFFIQVRCELCGKTKNLRARKRRDQEKLRAKGFGNCPCGGVLSEDAPPRCPHCQSDDLDLGEIEIYYD